MHLVQRQNEVCESLGIPPAQGFWVRGSGFAQRVTGCNDTWRPSAAESQAVSKFEGNLAEVYRLVSSMEAYLQI